MASYNEEEYLEAIFHLIQKEKKVTTSRLAERLKVTPASASSMAKKLAKEGLIKHRPYRGIVLTKEGLKEATKLVRRHRLSERFLTDVLGLDWDKAHDEACKFEHVLSDAVEEKLDKALGSPKTCPHGNPIPSKTGKILEKVVKPLSSLKPKERGFITKITNEEPKLLQYLATLGLLPQALVCVEEVAPFAGPLLVRVSSKEASASKNKQRQRRKEGASYALGRDIASCIWVEKGHK